MGLVAEDGPGAVTGNTLVLAGVGLLNVLQFEGLLGDVVLGVVFRVLDPPVDGGRSTRGAAQ